MKYTIKSGNCSAVVCVESGVFEDPLIEAATRAVEAFYKKRLDIKWVPDEGVSDEEMGLATCASITPDGDEEYIVNIETLLSNASLYKELNEENE